MKKITGLFLLFYCNYSWAQYQITLHLNQEETHVPISAASIVIPALHKGGISDTTGFVTFHNIPSGSYKCQVSAIGYQSTEVKLSFPQTGRDTLEINLELEIKDLGEVVVSTTRTGSKIKEVPIRVEVLGTEDIQEETDMHPSNVAMLLSETSGVQTQQTSVSSGNVQIRILGLDGKYTQLLKDGFPMFSGFSNGLSIMQIPPLDLQQVELIKGSSSSLYGGDAIAGIINFISQKPVFKPQWTALINQTSRTGTDAGSFYATRNKRWGITLLNTFTHQEPGDIHNDGFTVLPKLTEYTINPKIFWYPIDSITLSLSVNATYDNRIGGDLYAVKNGPSSEHPYIEKNLSNRDYYQFRYQQHLAKGQKLNILNSASLFNRDIGLLNYSFSGKQTSTYSEISYLFPWKHHRLVAGLNFITDQLRENRQTDSLLRNYYFATLGAFLQDDWTLNKKLVLEIGIRNDYQNRYGSFFLPRISLLYRINGQWSARLGCGLGYKSATIFEAQTEERAYKNVLPIAGSVRAEKSGGGNLNINYTGRIGEDIRLIFDQSFFFTQVNDPLILDTLYNPPTLPSYYYFANADRPFTTRGLETSLRLTEAGWSLFLGYAYIDARSGNPFLPHISLTPRNKVVLDLSKEVDHVYRIALEAFYTGKQYLHDGTPTQDYFVTGLLLQRNINRVSLILNFEDLTDTRQTRFGPVVIPPNTNPSFREIYAPMEGFMVNLAVKVRII